MALRAIFSLEGISLYEIRGILESLPDDWKRLLSVKRALSDIVNKLCRSHFHEISKSRYYQPLPLEEITRITGISTEAVYGVVVDESAQHPNLFGSDRLFTLVGLIASQISPQEAQDVLQFGLALLEEEMEESDGDGQWKADLEPSSNPVESLAGYIWARLADPVTSWRWQAAHVICLLHEFDEAEVLCALARFALGQKAKAYSDASLPFYEYSAKQWLLIAIYRAVASGCTPPQEMIEFLLISCREREKHVILRGFAARSVLTLFAKGAVKLDELERTRLENTNQSGFPAQPENSQTGYPGRSKETEVGDNDRYYFGLDMPQYWFSPLGRVFGLSSSEVERRTLKVIRQSWNLASRGAWAEDPRGKLGIYQGMNTHHSHGSYPRTESLSFYHAYHAMMLVAGELIDTEPTLEQPSYYDRLEDWLQRHWITRGDGKWLADRRDPKPPAWPEWKDTKETDDWPFSVSKDDLLSQLNAQDGFVPVWGGWNEVGGDREQSVRISSALVSKQTSGSLLRALQTVQNPMDYRIPTAGDEVEVDSAPFKLRGWISESSRDFGIDEFDPWAGEIHYPPLRPASWICERFGLFCDPERRIWRNSTKISCEIFRSWNWGRREEDREYHTPETGERLELSKTVLADWLTELEMDLIVEVQLRREFRRGSYRKREASIGEYVPPYTLVLLMKPDGSVETI